MQASKLLVLLVSATLVLSIFNLYFSYRAMDRINEAYPKQDIDGSGADDFGRGILPDGASLEYLGSADAPVTIVEFSDFQCPYCAKFYFETFGQLHEKYIKSGKVKFAYRHFPLSFHENAQKAAEASECAREQNKFWEYADKLFANQKSLGTESLKKYAAELGLDAKKFNECLDSGKAAPLVQADLSDGLEMGVSGTPAFLINEKLISGAQPFSAFETVIEQELNKAGSG